MPSAVNQTVTTITGSEEIFQDKNLHNKELDPEILRKEIIRINQEGEIRNLEKFGPLTDDDLVIVVQVR